MNKELEAVMSEFHGSVWMLHAFAALFFARRGRFGWAAFHLGAAVVSFICSHFHKRDSR